MTDSVHTSKISTAKQPDLDWSQVRETILMLNLATARIECCMRVGDDSVDTLTNSFTTMAGNVAAIRSALDQVWQQCDVDQGLKTHITEHCQKVSEKMKGVIMAFQFYDRLVQRLAHISSSMSGLADLVGDPERLYSPYEWKGLQEKIRSQYSMPDEHKLFDALMAGISADEVVKMMQKEQPEMQSPDGDIEMF